jgi:putative transposase
MAKEAVLKQGISIRLACECMSVSETCYRYQPILSDENAEIADWLIRLTSNQRNWGFGLCFLFLRNVKAFRWNHKWVYRIYRALELNMRIKPKKRIVREKPEPLAVPTKINECWSTDGLYA